MIMQWRLEFCGALTGKSLNASPISEKIKGPVLFLGGTFIVTTSGQRWRSHDQNRTRAVPTALPACSLAIRMPQSTATQMQHRIPLARYEN